MKYSAVPQADGRIVMWRREEQEGYVQFPYLPVKRNERVTVEADFDDYRFSAAIEENPGSPGKLTWLPFTPDTPPILHRGKGDPPEVPFTGVRIPILGDEALKAYERFQQEIRERRKHDTPEFCEKSTQINSGWPHIWEPDGDGQWMVCHLCGVRRRA